MKLKIYRFLATFIPYFKRKLNKMSLIEFDNETRRYFDEFGYRTIFPITATHIDIKHDYKLIRYLVPLKNIDQKLIVEIKYTYGNPNHIDIQFELPQFALDSEIATEILELSKLKSILENDGTYMLLFKNAIPTED